MPRHILRLALALFVMTSQSPIRAQLVKAAANRDLPIRKTIAEAEAEGARYPHGPARERGPTVFAGRGPVARTCTRGPTGILASRPSEIRSGDFAIGGQLGGAWPPNVGMPSKIWWAPYHDPFDFPSRLLVRGARLGVRSDTFRYARSDYGWPASSFPRPINTSERKADSFFPSGITIPHAGEWLLVATAGDDWGCFILNTKT